MLLKTTRFIASLAAALPAVVVVVVSGFHQSLPHPAAVIRYNKNGRLVGLAAVSSSRDNSKENGPIDGSALLLPFDKLVEVWPASRVDHHQNGHYEESETRTPPLSSSSPSLMPMALSLSLLVVVTASASPAMAALIADSSSLAISLAGPIPSALLAWLHFVGIMGVAASLTTERLWIKRGLTIDEEMVLNNVDGLYGVSALSLLVSGYFRATDFAKGWDFYQHEPIFWLKMVSVAVLGGLSFFPTIVLFRRDQARRGGRTLLPLSDAIVDRMTTIINAELLAVLTIPLLASLMARGVAYYPDFPWWVGAALYMLTLGGAGYKYGREAFTMMESEGSLVEQEK